MATDDFPLTDRQRIAVLEATVEFLSKEYELIKEQLGENTQLTKETKANTEELVTIFKNAKGANKVLLGFAKWVAIIAAGIAALIGLIHAIKDFFS